MLLLYRVQSLLVKACFYIACICMVYLTFFISLDVILRSFGISFFVGTVELSEYSLLAIALLCAPWVYRKNANLKVDILLMNRSERFKELHGYFVDLVILLSSLIVFYYGTLSFLESFERGTYVFKMLVFPEWYINWIIPLAMLLVSIEAFYRLFFLHNIQEA